MSDRDLLQRDLAELHAGFDEPEYCPSDRQRERWRAGADDMRRIVNGICDFHSKKAVAATLDISRPVLSQAVSGNSTRHHLYLFEHLPALLDLDVGGELAAYVAGFGSTEFTAEETLEAVLEASREYLGSEGRKGLLRSARHRLRQRRARRRLGGDE